MLDELGSLPLEDEECLLLRPLVFLLFLGPDESLLFPEEESLSDSEVSDIMLGALYKGFIIYVMASFPAVTQPYLRL